MPAPAISRIAIALAIALLPAGPAAAGAPAEPRPVDPEAIRLAIEATWPDVAAPGGSLEIVRLPALRHTGSDPDVTVTWPEGPLGPGPRAITVSCVVDGRTVARGLANVHIRVERPVWVLARPQGRGETLDATALVEQLVAFAREPGPLFTPEPGRKWRLRRDVEAGARLRARDVRPLPHVEAGSELNLVSRTGRASVVVPGRVRRGGDVGGMVLVHNPVTGALVEAQLIDRSTAILVASDPKGKREGRKRT